MGKSKSREKSKSRKKSDKIGKIGFDFLIDFWQKYQNAKKCHKLTLDTLVWVCSSVFQNVHFQVVNSICCKVAHCALVRFLPSVNENVCLQIAFYIERLVALWAHVFFYIFFVGCRRPCLLENVFGHWSQDSRLFITDKQNPVLSLLAGN